MRYKYRIGEQYNIIEGIPVYYIGEISFEDYYSSLDGTVCGSYIKGYTQHLKCSPIKPITNPNRIWWQRWARSCRKTMVEK